MTGRPRSIRRLSGLLALLAALWLVPTASAAGYDPFDVDAAGSTDPIPLDNPKYQCPFLYNNAPPGFTPPEGLPAKTECVVVVPDGSNPSTNFIPPMTQAVGVGTLGLAGAPHAAQYLKIPVATSAAVVPIHSIQYPKGPAAGDPAATTSVLSFLPRVWFLSADRKRVGELPPFRVRTLAFGSIPVQVTVHITQPRNPDGSVRPIEVEQSQVDADAPDYFGVHDASGKVIVSIYRNAYGKGDVNVGLTDLLVDGHPVDVGDSCRTATTGSLDLVGKGFYQYLDGTPQPGGTYVASTGGLLKGVVDIPPFTDCRGASGDDISPILTNVVSGDGNPISINQTASSNNCFPADDPVSCLAGLQPLNIPKTRPQKESPPPGPIPVPTS